MKSMVATPPPLRYPSPMPAYVDDSERAGPALSHPGNVLATVSFGDHAPSLRTVPWLGAVFPNNALGPCPPEFWPAGGTVLRITVGGAPAVADDRSVFVALTVAAGPGERLDALTFDVYRRLLSG